MKRPGIVPAFFLIRSLPAACDEEHMTKSPAWSLGIGIVLGAAIGLAFGVAMHDIGVGLAIGAGLGAALGAFKLSQKKRPR